MDLASARGDCRVYSTLAVLGNGLRQPVHADDLPIAAVAAKRPTIESSILAEGKL
jgi:hypothetical protein